MSVEGRGGFLFLGKLTPRDRRAILLGLGVMVPALAYGYFVRPYRAALEHARERVMAEGQLLARELALLEASDHLPDSIRRAREAAAEVEDRMLQAPSAVLAEAELTDFLEDAAVGHRVLLEEIRSGELARGETPPAGLSVIRLHLRGESDLEGILTFLDTIEKSRLILRVRGLALEPQMARSGGGGNNSATWETVPTGVVTFQLILDGFARPEEEPPETALLKPGTGQ